MFFVLLCFCLFNLFLIRNSYFCSGNILVVPALMEIKSNLERILVELKHQIQGRAERFEPNKAVYNAIGFFVYFLQTCL